MISNELLLAAATVGGAVAQMASTAWLTKLIRRELAPVVARVERLELHAGLAPPAPALATAAG